MTQPQSWKRLQKGYKCLLCDRLIFDQKRSIKRQKRISIG